MGRQELRDSRRIASLETIGGQHIIGSKIVHFKSIPESINMEPARESRILGNPRKGNQKMQPR